MYIGGVSTRKASKIVEGMCGFEVSAQMVSNTSKDLDARLTAWRNRSLGQMDYLLVDARYEQVRADGLVRDCAVLIAIGINPQGKREVLGIMSVIMSVLIMLMAINQNALRRILVN